jgi:hypothetical protein
VSGLCKTPIGAIDGLRVLNEEAELQPIVVIDIRPGGALDRCQHQGEAARSPKREDGAGLPVKPHKVEVSDEEGLGLVECS